MKFKMLTLWKESYDQPREHIKKQRHYFVNKVPASQSFGFSSGYVCMWELDYKESWVLLLNLGDGENSWESLGLQGDPKGVHPKGDQSWVFIGRTDAEVETPVHCPPHVKSWLSGKDPDAWERLRAWAEGDDRGWDDWMASPSQWTWVWVNPRSWWWTERPGMLQFMGLQRARHASATKLTESLVLCVCQFSLCGLRDSVKKDPFLHFCVLCSHGLSCCIILALSGCTQNIKAGSLR